jgi:hypothetical protein
MSTEEAELPGEEDERGWRERFAQVSAAGRPLLATRLEILREELAERRFSSTRTRRRRDCRRLAIRRSPAAALPRRASGAAQELVPGSSWRSSCTPRAGRRGMVCVPVAGAVRPPSFRPERRARATAAIADSLSPEPEPEGDDDGPDEPVDDIEERFRAGAE